MSFRTCLLFACLLSPALAAAHSAAAPDAVIRTTPPSITLEAAAFPLDGTGFTLEAGRWAALNPATHRTASAKVTLPTNNNRYQVTFHAVGEKAGQSSYELLAGGRSLGRFTCPPTTEATAEGPEFTMSWFEVLLTEGEAIEVRAHAASHDGKTFSRARWSKIVFTPNGIDPGRAVSRLELAAAQQAALPQSVPRQPDGPGTVTVTGELKQWHKVTLDLAGPFAAEIDTAPNPFTDLRLDVTFTHESGSPSYRVPGYFAADGRAAETAAIAGTVWRAHLSPDKPGRWDYRVSFVAGPGVATAGGGTPRAPFDGQTGSFVVKPTDKQGADFRAGGRLTVTGGHYLKRAGSGEFFLKVGTDAPETLLGYADFDDTLGLKPSVPLKTWGPHIGDWREGHPSWRGGRGKGLIGALNYLAAKGLNAVAFLTYNVAGDGDNVWPFIARDLKFHYDCSRLDQWGIVFDHASNLGIQLNFKLQEQENDDHLVGPRRTPGVVPAALDGGDTGPERKLYLRELIARFGHVLGLNWNLGEENTQTPAQQRAMAAYLTATDPYGHPISLHSFPEQQEQTFEPQLGVKSALDAASTQNHWSIAHAQTLRWIRASTAAGHPWIVTNDEQNPGFLGTPPDPGYRGYAGLSNTGQAVGYDLHDIRRSVLWGTLLAGGAGIEYFFGYGLPENDLTGEDLRSRDRSFDYGGIALAFFTRQKFPLDEMVNQDELVGNPGHTNTRYCFAQPGRLYLVYLAHGGTTELDLTASPGTFSVAWFNPRHGGEPQPAPAVTGGTKIALIAPDTDDWLVILRR